MRGSSRQSLVEAKERLETLLTSDGVDPARIGDDLFAITGVLAANAGVRRAFTDPSRDGEAKAGLAQRLFGGKVDGASLDLVAGAVRARWAGANDLVDAVETLAVSATLAGAERTGHLDSVEDELFRFARTVGGDTGLRDALSARSEGTERKATLVRTLLEGKVAPETVRLAVQAATLPRGQRTEQVLEGYVEAAAERRSQLVAQVVAALPLDEGQRSRLTEALRRTYGRDIRVNVDVDPDVVGGLRVQVGGEVVDGTVSTRIDEARRRFAG
jgi:F-type H+-transporting ATPase subunit delta